MKFSRYKLIYESEKLFKIKCIGNKDVENGKLIHFVGLLTPPTDNSIYSYNKPALCVEISINQALEESVVYLFVSISSIDDSGVSIYGQHCSLEQARSDMVPLIKYFKNLPEKYKCPNFEVLQKDMNVLKMYAQQW